ncbi:MAG: BTH_I0359 family protein [Burkholderiales bacterium]
MNIVYNSDNYYVVEYPAEAGYELVDKNTRRGTFFAGDVAVKFRQSMLEAAGETPEAETMDDFLSNFGTLINFPVTVH